MTTYYIITLLNNVPVIHYYMCHYLCRVRGWEGRTAGMLALDFPFDVTTKPNNKMPHPFVTVLMH
jgi:hypothetical protein